jgi:hypothetical protein
MRSTIIIGSVVALLGFGTLAQASDGYEDHDRSTTRVDRRVADDSRSERHDRYERRDRSGERRDAGRSRHESYESHDDDSHEERRHR